MQNKFNLPGQFERFAKVEAYSRGDSDISVTGLIGSAQIARLESEHEHELAEPDVSDNIMSILGTAVHSILEKGAADDEIIEKRFSINVDGVSVSGAIDCLSPSWGDKYDVYDWKVTSASTILFNPEGKREWEQQLNLYALLCRENGIDVGDLYVVCIIRDWVRSKAKYNPKNYPQQAVIKVQINKWGDSEQWEYLKSRLAAHSANVPAPCTPEEQWARPATYAVMATTASGQMGKRAKRVLESESEAVSWMMENGVVGSIQKRPGALTRCSDWCSVADHCDQYQSTLDTEDYVS